MTFYGFENLICILSLGLSSFILGAILILLVLEKTVFAVRYCSYCKQAMDEIGQKIEASKK